jgi:hypothetical protein
MKSKIDGSMTPRLAAEKTFSELSTGILTKLMEDNSLRSSEKGRSLLVHAGFFDLSKGSSPAARLYSRGTYDENWSGSPLVARA